MKGGQSNEPHFIGVKYVRLAESTIQKLKKGKATMKKFFSFMMAVVLVLSMSVTAFAADGQGSITITNATKDESYSVYKLFDATYSGDAVSYTIEEDDQFFEDLFGTTPNPFFSYNASTGSVTKNEGVNDPELIEYLTGLVAGGTFTPAVPAVKATGTTVTFSNLDYGYYIIKSTLGTTVTINSNTPDVEVIDKNQQGATSFDKQIETVGENGEEVWGDSNSASFGDTVEYKITFKATNYDGENQVQFYSVYDTTGAAISPDFNSITVKVGDQTLTKGYLIGTGDYKDNNSALGSWDGTKYNTTAEWYLVQSSTDEFRISIPWMSNHTLNGDGTSGYSLAFGEGAKSKFESPVTVEITYEATVEDNANIGGASYNTAGSNNINTAHVKWYFHGGTDSTINDTVHTYVYGIGILKEDFTTKDNLSGAEFEVYSDAACNQEVKFVTTGIKGVYNHAEGGTRSNRVVSQVNGKIVLLGLNAGTYYLKEVKAPDGYNALSAPVKIEVREGTTEDFSVYAKADGEVADTEQDMTGYTKHTYGVTKATVGNSKGVELPSTGGKGTTMLITFGSLIAIGFAVFLITHKKMSIYTD